MDQNNLSDEPKEMDVKTGPGGLVGIIIIVLIILLAGIYVFMKQEKQTEIKDEGPAQTEEITDENVEDDVASLDAELNSMDSDLASMETELNNY